MSNQFKKIVSIIGMAVGLIIIIIGFCLQDTSNYGIGESIRFGADFYTEIYAVTQDVGRAINYAINDLICAVSWLIIAIGAIDICFFAYVFAKTLETSNHYNIKNIDKNVQLMAAPIIREAEEKARREADVAAERVAAKAKQTIQKKEKTLSEKLAYALMFQSDDGMVSYLKGLQDETVQDILKSPQHLIREQIKNLLAHL